MFVRYEFETGRYIEERKKMPRRYKEKNRKPIERTGF
jgi:hypothetical protein